MDEKHVVKVADRRLINDYEYSTPSTSTYHDTDDRSGNSYNDAYIDWSGKAEECIAAAIRVGLSCTAQQPKDRWTMREASTTLQGIRQFMLGL